MKNIFFLLAVSLSLSNVQAQSKNEDWSRAEIMWASSTPEEKKKFDAVLQAERKREIIKNLILFISISSFIWIWPLLYGIVTLIEWCNWRFKKLSIDKYGNLIT